MSNKKALYVEVMDRTHVIIQELQSRVLEHQAIDKSKRLRKKTNKCIAHLAELYQMIGEQIQTDEEPNDHEKIGDKLAKDKRLKVA